MARPTLLLTLMLAAPAAWAGDFVDTTVTFVAGDDNVFAGAGETIPSSPDFDFRPRPGSNLFFDNYDSRNTGEETRTNLVLYKSFDGYFGKLTPEAAMVLQWDANRAARDGDQYESNGSVRVAGGIRDDGSYMAIKYAADAGNLSLVLFPFDSDRFRLGYSWELTWGGRSSFVLANTVPAARLSFDAPNWYVFVGAKTARTQNFEYNKDDPASDENETVYGLLAGGGLKLDSWLIEAEAGYFQKGTIPTPHGSSLEGKPVDELGASFQVTYSDGMEPKRSTDTKLLRNAGEAKLKPRDFAEKKLSWLVSTEWTLTSQQLEEFEVIGETKRETGYAGDVNVVVRNGHWGFNADVVLRSVEFLVRDTNGLYTYSTVAKDLDVKPEFFGSVGVDYRIAAAQLIPGVTFGVQQPATAERTRTDPTTGEQRTDAFMVRRNKDVLGATRVERLQLPANEEVLPVMSGRLTLTSHLSDLMSVVAEGQLSWDRNMVTNDPDSGQRQFESPWILGLSLLAQAKF